MTLARVSETLHERLGWCPNAPVMHAAQAVQPIAPVSLEAGRSSGSGTGGTPGRIRGGISLAVASIKSLFRNRRLLGFLCLFGIVILALVAGEAYILSTTGNALPFLFALQAGGITLILDGRLFLLQLVCLSCLTLLFAALIQYRFCEHANVPRTIRESFSATGPRTAVLAALAVPMSLAGTVLFAVVTQTPVFGKIVAGISMTLFYLPYAYYFPNLFGSAIWFSAILAAIATFEFLAVICAVPFILREDRDLVGALGASFGLMRRMWQEIAGCLLVFGAIFLVTALAALVIGQSPQLIGHDYDFFLQISRGKILMMAACYGFVLACGIILAAGFAVLGIAVADLNSLGTAGQVRAQPDAGKNAAAEPLQ